MLPRAEIMVQASVAVIRVIAELLPSMAELSRQQATATVRASVAEDCDLVEPLPSTEEL